MFSGSIELKHWLIWQYFDQNHSCANNSGAFITVKYL